MSKNLLIRGHAHALNRSHKVTFAGIAAIGAAAIGFSAPPSGASTTAANGAAPTARTAHNTRSVEGVRSTLTDQLADAGVRTEPIAAKKTPADAPEKQVAEAKKTEREHESDRANRSGDRQRDGSSGGTVVQPARTDYPDNLDGWIRESLDIMRKRGIPGSYAGIHRNIIRESSGDPMAINLWDSNARNGVPSKGLLQVIPPTFAAYHVPGTSKNIYDPVANITAACNYAADRYGSMDNVNSAY